MFVGDACVTLNHRNATLVFPELAKVSELIHRAAIHGVVAPAIFRKESQMVGKVLESTGRTVTFSMDWFGIFLEQIT